MWVELRTLDAPAAVLRWEGGDVTGTGWACEQFQQVVDFGEPVSFLTPGGPLDPGSETIEQFLATAWAIPTCRWGEPAFDRAGQRAYDKLTYVPPGAEA
jgi:hypothetical protein